MTILFLNIAATGGERLGDLLAQCGLPVRTARDVGSATGVLLQHAPALAVVHVGSAATVDAEDALRALSEIPVIVVAAQHDPDLIVRWLGAGADTVLVSPLSRRELAARIRAVLGWHSSSQRPATARRRLRKAAV